MLKVVQIKKAEPEITCSVLEASALFNMHPDEFAKRYIHTGRLRLSRLHQLSMKFVLKIYDAEKRGPWQRYKPFDI